MSKGRQVVKDQKGNPIFIDTVPKESALQGVLVNQDAIVAQLNAIQTALITCATALAAATTVANVASAGSALESALNALAALSQTDLR